MRFIRIFFSYNKIHNFYLLKYYILNIITLIYIIFEIYIISITPSRCYIKYIYINNIAYYFNIILLIYNVGIFGLLFCLLE